MKKILLTFCLFVASLGFAAEPLMIIKPYRETFLNFPSSVVNDEELVVTVFLPEAAIPLRKKYPVVYVLGIGPQNAEAVKEQVENAAQKAIIVGVKWGKEIPQAEKASVFFSRELIPYIDSNYPTFDEPLFRAISAEGAENASKVAALLAKKNLFAKAVLLNAGKKPYSLAGADASLRVLLAGKRADVVAWQEIIEEKGLAYGAGFVTKLGEDLDLLPVIDLDFLFAKEQDLFVKKITGSVFPDKLFLKEDQKAFLAATVLLNNGMQFDYMPLSSLRLSPHYLDWNAQEGSLSVIHGAEKGKVKISFSVDKASFKSKIRLKK